ncbi:MAG: DNA-binding HxlR family transcriptional regulator [Kiritimatiellia bacterium]|jgi:DNA-binding HxlR family transcriptional regulator
MKKKPDASSVNPYEQLHKLFHEPGRLAILSELIKVQEGMKFRELKDACNLTDGNLNRHLKTLDEAGAIRIRKRFVDAKPQTTVQLTAKGMEGFLQYLKVLQDVLIDAASSLGVKPSKQGVINWKTIQE